MSINPTFIDFCNKLARVESINPTEFHTQALEIMGNHAHANLSEALYELKTKAILQGLADWKYEGRELSITQYKYGGDNHEFIFVVEVKSLDLKRTFKFHIFDFYGSHEISNDIHHSKSEKNKMNSQLPFSNLDWLEQLNKEVTPPSRNDRLYLAS